MVKNTIISAVKPFLAGKIRGAGVYHPTPLAKVS